MLDEMDKEYDMFTYVQSMYAEHGDPDQMIINGKVLWIMRKENDFWQKPEPPTMEETGPPVDTIPL